MWYPLDRHCFTKSRQQISSQTKPDKCLYCILMHVCAYPDLHYIYIYTTDVSGEQYSLSTFMSVQVFLFPMCSEKFDIQ